MTSKSPGADPAESQGMVIKNLISGFTGFCFQLFAEVSRQESGKNIFLSPPSVATLLALLHTGTAGETQQELANALGLKDMSLREIQQASDSLRTSLSDPDPVVELRIANSLWTHLGLEFKSEFLGQARQFFGAEIHALDFADHEAPEIVNRWADTNTRGKIRRIVEEFDPDITMLLVNAIYFKGKWKDKFHIELTEEKPFYLADSGRKKVPMMFTGGEYRYYRGESFQAAVLPFGKGRIGFYVFLPDESIGMPGFLKDLNREKWNQWMSQFQLMPGDILLPRFKVEYKGDLTATLQALGLETLFNRNRANFEQIRIERDLFVNSVMQKAVIEVNEEGAEAAAVTSMDMLGLEDEEEEPEERFTLNLNRPFFLVIRDNQTEMVLFLGVVNEPNS
jgi:serine protease inhibitor